MAETLDDILTKWGEDNIAEAVALLSQSNISSSGGLADSLRVELTSDLDKISLKIFENDYGKFVREGVQGALSSARAPQSPFSYKDKLPPAGPINKWAIRKGLQGVRDDKGRFVKRKSLVFLIRRSIFRLGISPFNYLSPFFKNINDLQGLITENQKREILLLLQSTLNESAQQRSNTNSSI